MSDGSASGLDLELVELADGERFEIAGDASERVVVVLGGHCALRLDDGEIVQLGSRADVFDGPASALYLPRGAGVRIHADVGAARLAIAAARTATPAPPSRRPYVIRPGEVRIEQRGRGAWTREVHTILGADHPADRLLVGETFNGDGVWSTYPPHKHDDHAPPRESRFDERFLVQVRPRSGFAVFIHYRDPAEREQALVVRDGDILPVEDGYHSFVAAAGYRFYYLWVLAGETRELILRTDPRHEWLLEPEGTQA